MLGSDRVRRRQVSFHIGGPLLPNALCGERRWMALIHYDSIAPEADFTSLCPECRRIHREQHSTPQTRSV